MGFTLVQIVINKPAGDFRRERKMRQEEIKKQKEPIGFKVEECKK